VNDITGKSNNSKRKKRMSYKLNQSKKIMLIPTINDLLALCFLMNDNRELTVRGR